MLKRLTFSLVCFFWATGIHAEPGNFHNSQLRDQIESLFEPGHTLLDAKLIVDGMVSAGMSDDIGSIEQTRSLIGAMAASLKTMTAGQASSNEKLVLLRRYIYEAGYWNNGRPFRYDRDDPSGTNPSNRFLLRYLETRRGNCVTMPILFAILGQSIGLRLTLAEAPLHVLVKYTDDDGKTWNLEATSGAGFTRDSHYRRHLPMSDAAIANGVYLRALNGEESAGLTATFLIEHFLRQRRFEDAIIAADVILKHYPRSAYVMTKRGTAFAGLLRRDVLGKYTRMDQMTPETRAYADRLFSENIAAFKAAEALGWRETDGIAAISNGND